MQQQGLMVLSTVSLDNLPESATVECAVTDEFEVVFDTFQYYRKYKNLSTNPNVCCVFGFRDDKTVQFEGTAEELKGQLLEYYQGYYLRKIPTAKKFAAMDDVSWFRIKPKWVRYTDVSKDPYEVVEIDLKSDYVCPELIS